MEQLGSARGISSGGSGSSQGSNSGISQGSNSGFSEGNNSGSNSGINQSETNGVALHNKYSVLGEEEDEGGGIKLDYSVGQVGAF